MKRIAVLAAALFIVSCSTSGPLFTEQQTNEIAGRLANIGEPQCKPRMTLDYWEAKWGIHIGDPIPDDVREYFVGRFNATEPVSNYNPARVYLLKFQSFAIVIFHDGNCITLVNQYPVAAIRYWLSSADAPRLKIKGMAI